MTARQIIEADLTWMGERFASGVCIAVDERGLIAAAGESTEPPTIRLRNRALIPGMINAHSHAFQRGLRGLGERFPEGAGSFWTWRESMYRLVESMDEPAMYRLSRQAFAEMLSAGITTVGEFHYLHHDARQSGYALDEVVLRAGADAGIRIVLILTYYKTGGIGKPLEGGQRRFSTESPDEFWSQFDHLAGCLESCQSLAAAAHSIRAVSIDEVAALHEEACRRGLPFHMHVEEQPLEIEECLHVYGKTPMALINDRLAVNPLFTAVHCTHTAAADMEEYVGAGGTVCINPLTEGNLGDGIPNLQRMLKAGGRLAIGSDSNSRLCWTEELRWLEYVQRLAAQSRGICADAEGHVARRLLAMATIDGARSLGLKAGRIAAGHVADFAAIDLNAPSLVGWSPDTLLDSFIFGSGNQAIAEVFVGGRPVDRSPAPGR